MYPFGRAYSSFVARVRRFFQPFQATSRRVWTWFWSDDATDRIETALRVVDVIGFTYLLIALIFGSGHGWQFGLLFLLGIFVGWRPPLMYMARGLAAIAAAAGVVLPGSIVAALACLIFLPYLTALVALTALSCVLFVPMRLVDWLYLGWRRIAYHCPYDDCPYKGLPIHICKCGTQYADLRPGFYGLFYHVCRHPDGDERLPTLDWLGRNKLPRLCGGCRRPLIHSSVGELPVWPVFVVGGPSAGKTVWLAQAVRRLIGHFTGRRGAAHIDNDAQRRDYEGRIDTLDNGQLLAKTAGDVMQALGLAVRVRKGPRFLLYLFDEPGEYFTTMRRFGAMQALAGLKGIVLLVDPFSLPALAGRAQQLGADTSDTPFRTIVENLINTVDTMLGLAPHQKCPVPLAIVLAKADALPEGLCAPGAPSDRCREALLQVQEERNLRDLEQKFARVNYFAASALGRMPDRRNPNPYEPAGVAEPLLWVFDQISSNHRKGLAGQKTPSPRR